MSDAFDWNHFNKIFDQYFPGHTKSELGPKLDLSWIDKHIEDTLKRSLPATQSSNTFPYTADIVEVLDYVIVKVAMPAAVARKTTLRLSTSRLDVTVPGNAPKSFKLPALVQISGSRANYSNGELEIRMKKEAPTKFYNLEVRFL